LTSPIDEEVQVGNDVDIGAAVTIGFATQIGDRVTIRDRVTATYDRGPASGHGAKRSSVCVDPSARVTITS
jgi:UDP-3-O-[3-hydroxymyristoyl] glucosamine N-acyltransferase